MMSAPANASRSMVGRRTMRAFKRQILSQGAVALAMALASCASAQPAAPVANVVAAPVPSDLDSAVRIAQMQRQVGDLAGATRTLGQLVLIAPDDPRVLGEYGKTLVDRGEPADALAFLQRAIELKMDDWTLHSAQGVAFAQTGDYRAAQAAFGRALAVNPGQPSVLNNLALAHLQAGELDRAEALLLQASASGANLPRVEQNLALVRRLKSSAPAARPAPQPPAPPAPVANLSPPVAVTPAEPAALAEIALPEVVAADPPPAPPAPAALVPPPAPAAAPAPVAAIATPQGATVIQPLPQPVQTVTVTPPVQPEVREAAPQPAEASPVIVTRGNVAQGAPRPLAANANVPPAGSVVASAPLPPPAVAESRLSALSPMPSSWPVLIQVGSFGVAENAERLAASLQELGGSVSQFPVNGRVLHRVRVGPFADTAETEAALARLSALGFDDVRIFEQGTSHAATRGPARTPSLRFSENADGAPSD